MLSSAPRPNAIVPGPHGLTGEHADISVLPIPCIPIVRAAQIIFRPNYLFPCTASSKLCNRHCCLCQSVPASLYRSVAMAGMSGMRERTQMRGPKCGPKLDPNVWTQFSPIGIRTDGLQPNLGPQGIGARFRTTFGSTFWVHILGPRVRVHSTRLAPHIQCQRGELNQKKTNKK